LKYAVADTELLERAVHDWMIPFRPWGWQIDILKSLFKTEVFKEVDNCVFEVRCGQPNESHYDEEESEGYEADFSRDPPAFQIIECSSFAVDLLMLHLSFLNAYNQLKTVRVHKPAL